MHVAHTVDISAAKMLSEMCTQITGAECKIVQGHDKLYAVSVTPRTLEQEQLVLVYTMACQDQRTAIALDNGAR